MSTLPKMADGVILLLVSNSDDRKLMQMITRVGNRSKKPDLMELLQGMMQHREDADTHDANEGDIERDSDHEDVTDA